MNLFFYELVIYVSVTGDFGAKENLHTESDMVENSVAFFHNRCNMLIKRLTLETTLYTLQHFMTLQNTLQQLTTLYNTVQHQMNTVGITFHSQN